MSVSSPSIARPLHVLSGRRGQSNLKAYLAAEVGQDRPSGLVVLVGECDSCDSVWTEPQCQSSILEMTVYNGSLTTAFILMGLAELQCFQSHSPEATQ